jgi:hypothetical protein
MSKSTHVLNIKKENTVYKVDMYTQKKECNTGNRWITANVENQTVFMPLTSYLGERATGGSTPVRILKNNTVYQLVQHGEFYLKIQQSPNQTITLHAGGQSWTDENEHWFPYGTQWHATVSGHSGWNAGTLNVTDGTLINSDIVITASPATLAIPSGSLLISEYATWVCPQYINCIKTRVGVFDFYYDVTAGNSYTIRYDASPKNKKWYINGVPWFSATISSITIEWGPHINK